MINLYTHGNLVDDFENGKFDVIVQGCNCFHTMGAGIAKTIAERFPVALSQDIRTPYGSWDKLGDYSRAETFHGTIVNGYTQYEPGRENRPSLYQNIETLFKKLNVAFRGSVVGIPQIGCGIAGGEWDKVAKIINDNTPDLNIVVVLYEANK